MLLVEPHAGKFVFAAWILVVLTVGAAPTIGVGAAISADYHPLHPSAPFQTLTVHIILAALIGGIAVAVLSSVALACQWRRTAWLSILVVWCALGLGSLLAYAWTQPGPEIFERYVGDQRFLVPWQYQAGGPSVSHTGDDGFGLSLCINSLHGYYDKACDATKATYVLIKRRGSALSNELEVRQWRTRHESMERLASVDSYEQYRWQYGQGQFSGQAVYYVRHDAEGHLTRLVRCGRIRTCEQHTLTGDYELTYGAPFGPNMDSTDAELARLISSWRVRD